MDKYSGSRRNKYEVTAEGTTESEEQKSGIKSAILGYTFAFLVILTYIISVVSAQLSVKSTPVFQRSCMRYVSQTLITLTTVALCRSSVKVKWGHLYMILIIAVVDFAYNYCFYLAAAYLPVGNMEGIFSSLIVIILGFYDICRKKCEHHQVFAGLICSLGLLLLLQPWEIEKELKVVTDVTYTSPCESLGRVDIQEEDVTSDDIWTSTGARVSLDDDIYTTSETNMTTDSFSMITATPTDDAATVSLFGNETTPNATSVGFSINYINEIWKGYVLIVSATICMAIISVFIGKMTADLHYHPAVVSFWAALLNALTSIILMLSLEEPKLPSASYCVLFTFLLAILSACNAFFSHITLNYLLPSQTALVLSISMVVLFVCQNTSLPGIQPGRGNVMEVVGAVVTFVGAVSSPIYQLFIKSCRIKMKTKEVGFENEAMEETEAC